MKIQELPETQRKIILWTAVVILGIILFVWWGKNSVGSLQNISLPEPSKEIQQTIEQATNEFSFPDLKDLQELEYGE